MPGDTAVPPVLLGHPAGSPWVEFTRGEWSELAESTPMPLTAEEIHRLSGLGDPIDLEEVQNIYLPLSRLLNLYVGGTGQLHRVTSSFLREKQQRTPFIIGVAGSVAVGKSTTARVLKELLCRWPDTPRVELVTTDGFLYPNHVLQRKGLMQRKGFPESYDRRALIKFVADVKSGVNEVRVPRYDHVKYDILPGDEIVVHRPDVLIVEGLNVLQPARLGEDSNSALALSDFFDFSIYVDAKGSDIQQWFVERFLKLRKSAFAEPGAFFHQFASLTDEQAVEFATGIWGSINEPNLINNIRPTRGRANLVLRKGSNHSVNRIRLRKL
ncbi:type I pantothenate kinase [Nakamurella antarctica]|nr:type I pantothenate kinase [Nakamurella antarctica]